MTQEEKILILGSLFHDIGKFVQRCTDKSKPHPSKGIELIDECSNEFINILGGENNFNKFKEVVLTHHNPQNELSKYCREADHISASERVSKEENEEGGTDWNNNFLCSIFTKLRLNSTESVKPRYFKHEQLTKENFNALIPLYDENDNKAIQHKYTAAKFQEFKTQLKIVLSFYKDENDFDTVLNLLLVLFEKWLWCVPDFTGSSQTDISLFNHLKDVAGLSHAIFKTQQDKSDDKSLNLVIGDIPGIQAYIFDVIYKKPAKILRGRSIFIQVLARNFASRFLEWFGLTECNLIMLAGGKFYIVAPNTNDFKERYNKAVKEIEKYLSEAFNYEMSFVAGFENFDWEKFKKRKITFGESIEKATEDLNRNKSHVFRSILFENTTFDETKVILPEDYIEPSEGDSNTIKCRVTDKPIRKGREGKIPDGDGGSLLVDEQVETEYTIGDEITGSNLFLILGDNRLTIKELKTLKKINRDNNKHKLLVNPVLDDLLKESNKNFLKNTLFLVVANYCSDYYDEKEKKTVVMPFDIIAKQNDGAQYLTLIKGDVDNLGMLMALGLTRDKNQQKTVDEERDLTAISRTTTLSNHLKYYFSFFLNGYLKNWTTKENFPEINEKEFDQYVYTVFAGGDDLMLICPWSSSLKLLQHFDEQFNDFVCCNNEIHISYSLTNFKHNTPIRIVAEMAEENQKESKKRFKSKEKPEILLENTDCFAAEKNKYGTYLFNTAVKNNRLTDILFEKEQLVRWVLDNNNPVTMGTIRNLLQIAEIIKEYDEKKDTSKLIWHPMLTYSVNRNIKGKKGTTKEVEDFFEKVLSIYKNDEAKKIKDILYPVLCETIYKLRNK